MKKLYHTGILSHPENFDAYTKDDLNWFFQALSDCFRLPSEKPIDEWAEENMFLPSNVSEPGRYSLARTPYAREWLRDLSPDSGVNEVILLTGAQVGKTQVMLDSVMYHIDELPANQIYVFPDAAILKEFIKTKLDPLIEANPKIKAKLSSMRRSSNGNNLDSKEYQGFVLNFATAAAPNSLRSVSAGIVYADEVDGYKITSQGDPIELLRKRMNTFGSQKKFILSSTPVNGNSLIINAYEHTDRRVYRVPCPNCHSLITLDFNRFHWIGTKDYVKEAWIECPLCHYHIHNFDKEYMLDPKNGAHWEATNEEETDPAVRGYFLPSLYSPPGWLSFESVAKQYLKAQDDKAEDGGLALTAFYNTVLAEQYKIVSARPDWRELKKRGDTSGIKLGTVPEWVTFITTGSDVQADRVETSVLGWGRHGRNVLIEHVIVYGSNPEDTTDLKESTIWVKWHERIVNGTWEREDGVMLEAAAHLIDSSYNRDVVLTVTYGWQRVFPVHGLAKLGATKPEMRQLHDMIVEIGNKRPKWWNVNVNQMKVNAYAWLLLEDNKEHTQPFYCTFPEGLPDSVYMQTCAEKFTEPKGLNHNGTWEKIYERNECLDCRGYAMAGWYLMELNLVSDDDYDQYRETLLTQKMTVEEKKEMRKRGYGRRIVSRGLQTFL